MTRFIFALLIAGVPLFSTAAPAAKSFPWDSFPARPLKHAVNLDDRAAEKHPTDERQLILTGDYVLSKATVTFTGVERPLSASRRAILERWALLKNYAAEYTRLYDDEFLFLEGARKYWLAVQRPVALSMRKQLKKNHPVELYLLSGVGAERINHDWDWLLLVQEYQIPQ
jgi:hypothetical protein